MNILSPLRLSAAMLCSLSLSAFGMTENTPEFGASSSWCNWAKAQPPTDQNLSIAAWFKVTKGPYGGTDHMYDSIFGFAGRGGSTLGLIGLFYNNSQTSPGIGLRGYPTGMDNPQVIQDDKSLNDDAWHFAVATLDGATYALYLDGELVGTTTGTTTRDQNVFAKGLAVGADTVSGKQNFPGYVTETTVWTRTLSAEEVGALYANKLRLSGQEGGLWLYWPLNDDFGEGARDATGNGRNGAYNDTSKVPITAVETPFTAVGSAVVVSFFADDVKVGDDIKIIPDTACTEIPADPLKTGFRFVGWSRDGGETVLTKAEVAGVKLSESTTWVAQFVADSRTSYDLPSVPESLVYTGEVQKPEIGEGRTAEWTGDWTHVGEHSVVVKLLDPDNSVWKDGTTEDKPFSCTIVQAENGWKVEPSVKLQWAKGDDPDIKAGEANFGGVPTMEPDEATVKAFDVGAHTVKFAVEGTADYEGIEKSIDVFVVPSGLDPTGDPDTDATTYTWKNDLEIGYWYNPASWQSNKLQCYGFPANSFATAIFDAATNTVEGNAVLSYALAGLTVKSSDVTLKGGDYAPAKLTFSGTAPALTLADGAKLSVEKGGFSGVSDTAIRVLDGAELTPSHYQAMQLVYQTDVTLAVTNATFNTGISVRNGATGFTATFHNATFNAALELNHNGTPNADSEQRVTFSGADSDLTFLAGTGFGNQAALVRFEKGVNANFPGVVGGHGMAVGKNTRVEFVGENNLSNVAFYASYDGATVFYGADVEATCLDFGLGRDTINRTDCRTIISNATISAINQVYMPHPNKVNYEGCGVTFMGDRPRVTVGNTNVYIGKETLAKDEVLPSWRFVLPAVPYEVAPMVVDMSRADYLKFSSNTPIELDVSAVKQKGRYPLFTFKNVSPTVDVEALKEAMSAYKVRGTSQRDAKERVTLGWDEETKTIYADVAGADNLLLFVR